MNTANKIGRGKAFTKEEDQFLREHVGIMSYARMSMSLGYKRSPACLRYRAVKLGLLKSKYTK